MTSPAAPTWGRQFFRHAFDSLLSLPVVVVLHQLGYAGRAPLVVVVLVMLIASILQQPGVQRALAGGDLQRRLFWRIGLQLGLSTTLSIYLLGWGPLLIVGYAISGLQHIRWSGSRAWIPAVCWSLVGVILGQLATATGLLYTYLSPLQTQMGGIAGAILAVLLIRQFGWETAQREQAEQALQRNEQRFRALVQYSSDMTLVLDPAGVVSYVSPVIGTLLGRSPESVVGRPVTDLFAPPDVAPGQQWLEGATASTSAPLVLQSEIRLVHADGSERWHQVTLRNLLDEPAVGALVANHRDITEERLAKQQLAYEATHDLLTGVHNRSAFVRRLQRSLDQESDSRVAVLFIDLDGFKQVNDSFGHEAGDCVLAAVAGVLRHQVLGSDVIARLGGDEFAVALHQIRAEQDAGMVAQRIIEALTTPIDLGGRRVQVGASIGIALSVAGPGDTEPGDAGPLSAGSAAPVDADELLRRADQAMYRAKRARRSSWELYRSADEDRGRVTVDELRTAVAQGQLLLDYQPIVELPGGRTVGAEALVRWNHPLHGRIAPAEFIPLAEQSGLIGAVGDWVLRTACHQLAEWRRAIPGTDDLWIGVNMAADQLEDPATAEAVLSTLRAGGVPARLLVVEVTESSLADSAAALATLEQLHRAGVQVAIDDFGTGFSSLQYLTRLPVDILKLDRAFVSGLDGTPQGSAIAEAVARLAHTLQLRTTAEGVETTEQAEELHTLGYTDAQGYLYARPMAATDLTALLVGRPAPSRLPA